MTGVGPAQEPLARQVGHACRGDEVGAGPGPLDQRGVGPAQQPPRVVGERGGGGECRPDERGTARRLQAVPDDVADDQHGGVLRSFGHEIEVAADLLGGGHERRGQLQAGALGQLRRRERVADRAQVLELVLGHREAQSQLRELVVAHLAPPGAGARSACPGGARAPPCRGCRARGHPLGSAIAEALRPSRRAPGHRAPAARQAIHRVSPMAPASPGPRRSRPRPGRRLLLALGEVARRARPLPLLALGEIAPRVLSGAWSCSLAGGEVALALLVSHSGSPRFDGASLPRRRRGLIARPRRARP